MLIEAGVGSKVQVRTFGYGTVRGIDLYRSVEDEVNANSAKFYRVVLSNDNSSMNYIDANETLVRSVYILKIF